MSSSEQMEPVGWQFYQDGKWWNGDDRIKDHRKNTAAAGIPVRDVYAAPLPVEHHPECGCCGQTVRCDDDCDAVVLRKAEHQPDDAAVDRFAAAMKAKLNKKRQEGRGGWQSMTSEQLSALLHEHVRKGDPVDVANLAMMLHQNGQRIEQQPTPDVVGLVEALEEIIYPVRFMQERLEEGERLNGMAAVQLAEDASYLRSIAEAALAAYRKQETDHDNQ